MRQPIITKSLAVYEEMRRRILRRELDGVLLDESVLAEEYGVSRTPVREAFQRLAQEGLIEISPKRGASVKRLTVQDVREICQLRLCLEPQAALWSAGAIRAADLDAIEAVLRAERPADNGDAFLLGQHEVDRQLHSLVLNACRNARLRAIVNDLTTSIERLQVALFITNRLDPTIAEHLAIVEALRAQDGEASARAMRAHLEATQRALMELVFEQGDL